MAMASKTRTLVTGAGGFIGNHLVNYLKDQGHWVRGVDVKRPEYADTRADEFFELDLRRWESCLEATKDVEHVYSLAADMGGMGFISANHATIIRNNALIDIHTLDAARENGVKRVLYTSSACVYPEHMQLRADIAGLREEDAYPAAPQDAYGWEKLFAELLCQYFPGEFPIETRIARFHNIYGPLGTYDGGREKSPAAMCRKIALADDGGEIEVWGDGEQTRSFCYIDDCVDGIYRLMHSDYDKPVNLGTERMVSINELAGIIMQIADKKLTIKHVEGPEGVRGRNSDNTLLREVLDWDPSTDLERGLAETYRWIEKQLIERD
jgi:GDP-D-mannose 3', 5'-epimerase